MVLYGVILAPKPRYHNGTHSKSHVLSHVYNFTVIMLKVSMYVEVIPVGKKKTKKHQVDQHCQLFSVKNLQEKSLDDVTVC